MAKSGNGGKRVNVSKGERILSISGGGALLYQANEKRSLVPGSLGFDLLYRGVSRRCHPYQLLDMNTAEKSDDLKTKKSLTVGKPQRVGSQANDARGETANSASIDNSDELTIATPTATIRKRKKKEKEKEKDGDREKETEKEKEVVSEGEKESVPVSDPSAWTMY